MDESRRLELKRLDHELKKLDQSVAAMNSAERSDRVSLLRQKLFAKGYELTAVDEQMLARFIGGELQLNDLASHFQGRI